MKFWRKIMLMVSISFLCIGCDQGTKTLAENYLPKFTMDSYLYDIFRLGYAENTGAFLGIGSNLPSEYRFLIFIVVIALLLAIVLGYVVCSQRLTSASAVALTLFLSGGASNLYDRVINNGAVIDFLNMGVGSVRTGIFNVADVAIVAGGVLFALANRKRNMNRNV
jgi:signal peptidase II